jgi:GMP synthase (glutamine-hydrolysing)
MSPPLLLILKLGSTLPQLRDAGRGDFEDWIAQGLRAGGVPLNLRVHDPRIGQPWPMGPADADGVVLSGSHHMVTDREAWSEATAAWLRTAVAAGVPVLGICYGHQLLAHALGGRVSNHPVGAETGTTDVWRTAEACDDPLFAPLPSHWPVHVAHRQTVAQLPADAVLLAHNRFEPHHAFRVGPCAWGVQFHPEFSTEVAQTYANDMAKTTLPPHDATATGPWNVEGPVRETPEAAGLLARFARHVHERTCAPNHRGN